MKEELNLVTVQQFTKIRNWPPMGGLRWLIFHEHTNGFSRCVIRIGRRVLIDIDEFDAWINSHRSLTND